MTTKVHIISIAYGLPDELQALWDAVDSRHEVHWHLFRHSQIPDVMLTCARLARRGNVIYYPYGVNRGLAKSTNEGLLAAFDNGADVVLNIADDMLPAPGDVDRLVDFALEHRDHPCIPAWATHHNHYGGIRGPCELSFTAFNRCVLDTIGMQDENFAPAYFEDNDYYRRLKLLGYPTLYCTDTDIQHKGSQNLHSHPVLREQNQRTFAANRDYYIRKWGGVPGQEQYLYPFNTPRFGLRIAPDDRMFPYPGYDRNDIQSLVKL